MVKCQVKSNIECAEHFAMRIVAQRQRPNSSSDCFLAADVGCGCGTALHSACRQKYFSCRQNWHRDGSRLNGFVEAELGLAHLRIHTAQLGSGSPRQPTAQTDATRTTNVAGIFAANCSL